MFKLLDLRRSFNTLMLFKILKLLHHAALIQMLKIAQMLNVFDLIKQFSKCATKLHQATTASGVFVLSATGLYRLLNVS